MTLLRRSGLVAGPVAALLVLVAPAGLSPEAHRLAAVFALVVVYWVTEAIPLAVTALLGPSLAVVVGVAPAREAFASFGNPVLFLFLGSFLIARGMVEHGLDRRIALWVLSRRWVGASPVRTLLAFGAIAATLSMWISNTATTAMMLPIGLGVLGTMGRDHESARYGTGLMLMIAYSCNVGGMATPVGTPPNLIAIGMLESTLGRKIGFVEWMAVGLPAAIVCFALVYLWIRLRYVRTERAIEGVADSVRAARAEIGPWTGGARVSLLAFATAVVLWVGPSILSAVPGFPAELAARIDAALPEGVAAILAASLLFVVPCGSDRRPALSWDEAVRLDWGTILLFGGGLALGGLAFRTGLSDAIGGLFLGGAEPPPLWLLALVAVFVANSMTELMSNTATANLLLPLTLALGAAGSPGTVALAATLGCSLAFMLPVATPPNAIVYGSGRVPLHRMIGSGVVLDVACGLAVWLVVSVLAG